MADITRTPNVLLAMDLHLQTCKPLLCLHFANPELQHLHVFRHGRAGLRVVPPRPTGSSPWNAQPQDKLLCKTCHAVFYCSDACRQEDAFLHKLECPRLAASPNGVTTTARLAARMHWMREAGCLVGEYRLPPPASRFFTEPLRGGPLLRMTGHGWPTSTFSRSQTPRACPASSRRRRGKLRSASLQVSIARRISMTWRMSAGRFWSSWAGE